MQIEVPELKQLLAVEPQRKRQNIESSNGTSLKEMIEILNQNSSFPSARVSFVSQNKSTFHDHSKTMVLLTRQNLNTIFLTQVKKFKQFCQLVF